jgi:hypothetical protein
MSPLPCEPILPTASSFVSARQGHSDLRVAEGAVVQINVSTAIVLRATKSGVFEHFSILPGHKAAGMLGKLIVGNPEEEPANEYPDLSMDPNKVGEPVGKRGPKRDQCRTGNHKGSGSSG